MPQAGDGYGPVRRTIRPPFHGLRCASAPSRARPRGGAQMILSLLEYTARRVGVQPQPEGLNASLLWSAQPGAGL